MRVQHVYEYTFNAYANNLIKKREIQTDAVVLRDLLLYSSPQRQGCQILMTKIVNKTNVLKNNSEQIVKL